MKEYKLNSAGRITILMLLFTGIFFLSASCGKEKKKSEKVSIDGDWELMEFSGVKAKDESISVYVSFGQDMTFRLYQRLGAGRHIIYSGSYSLVGNVLSGTYSSGEPFGSEYTVRLESGSTILELTSSEGETSIYTACEIPSDVISEALITKSTIDSSPFL